MNIKLEILIIVCSIIISFIIGCIYFFSTYDDVNYDCVQILDILEVVEFNNVLFYKYADDGDIVNGAKVKELLSNIEKYYTEITNIEVINNVSGDIVDDNQYQIFYGYGEYGWFYDKHK